MFGEYSSESSADVRDNLVGWPYDNYREIKTATNIALTQCRIELKEWIQEMHDEKTPGDEIALFYSLQNVSLTRFCVHKKVVVDLIALHHARATAEELIKKCDRTLVFINPGIFGEIKAIRAPDIKPNVPATTASKPTENSTVKPSTMSTTMDGPSRRASRSRIRKSPRNRSNIDYKKLTNMDAPEGEKSPSQKT